MTESKKEKARFIVAIVLFVTLIASLIYGIVRFIFAPSEILPDGEFVKIKSDYLLIITQCLLGMVVMLVPSFFKHKLKIMVPNAMCILYYIFLYCSIFLGEVANFYYMIPHWDTLLHAMSGAMLGAVGFLLVDWLNKDKDVKVQLSPIYLSVFAFAFALMVGALWEIWEFSFDTLLGLNMQKHTTEEGVALIGKAALDDTMIDIIIDALSALVVAVIGYFTNIKRRRVIVSEEDLREEDAFENSETENKEEAIV